MSILIKKPVISQKEDRIRLMAAVCRPEGDFRLWYDFPVSVSKYLTYELGDPFVLGILEYSMHLGLDIVSEAPVSEELLYSLNTYYIPILSKNIKAFKHINISAPVDNEKIESINAVGTGFSGGVDSYYSILKHLNIDYPKYKLTHLLCVNVGAFRYEGGEISNKIFKETLNMLLPAADSLHLPIIDINTNYMEFYEKFYEPVNNCGALKTLSCVYALRKLFGIYYFASGLEIHQFMFSDTDPSFYDLFTLKSLSINGLKFYSSGSEVTRMQKIEFIADNPIVQKYLTVCVNMKNCGKCPKCVRTQGELYSLNKLDSFSEVFDIAGFKRHFVRRLAKNFALKAENFDGFNKEIISTAKSNNVKIPLRIYFLSFFLYRPFLKCLQILRSTLFIRKLYYRLNIDIILHGKEDAMIARQYYITKEAFNENKK